MLLKQLVRTVSDESDIPIEFLHKELSRLVEIFGISSFNDEDINSEGFSVYGILICEKLYEINLMQIKFSYYCHHNQEDEEVDSLSKLCIYCRKVLSESEDTHDYTRVYILNRESFNIINNYLDMIIQEKYFMPELSKNFESLFEDRNELIPFIGAGMSIPMGLPNWKELLQGFSDCFSKEIHRLMYEELIHEGDLFAALDHLIQRSQYFTKDDQIKDEVIKIISKVNFYTDERLHNYIDLAELKSQYYLTTNYDLCLGYFLNQVIGYNTPICMEDINNTREMALTRNLVIHLHGHINRKANMIVTKQDYEKLYGREELLLQLGTILGTKPLIFMGFSFNDKFFLEMYERLISVLNTHHYIVLFNPEVQDVRELNKKNLKVIGLRVSDKERDFSEAIRALIKYIK